MDNRPCLVSIFCAAFNHEKYLRSALEGFISQKTDFRFEVLINDDKSHDGTPDIIREYSEKYPDIFVPFYQDVNLYSQGKNPEDECFYPVAKGKYMAFCEGDDYWTDPLKLQTQVDFLEAHPEYSGCAHNSTVHDCSGREPDRLFVPSSGDHDVRFEDGVKGMSHAYHTSSLVARTDIIGDHKDFYYIAYKYGFSDYPDALTLLLSGPIWFIDRPMSTYRLCSNPGSWSSNLDAQYERLTNFINGEIQMLRALVPHLKEEWLPCTQHEILEREYELLRIEGRVEELTKPPYDEIFRSKSFSERAKINIKKAFPGLHRLYRKRKGYF